MVDSDWCNGSLTRFVPGARFLDVTAGGAVEEVADALSSAPVVLLDGLGPLQGYVFEWLNDSDFFRNLGEPVGLTYVVIVEEDKDSVFQAGEAVRALGDTGQWLVVRNLKTCPTTEIYNNSDARQQLLQCGAAEIQMDRVPWNLLLHIQRSGKTVGALAQDPALPFLERQRVKSYQAKFFEQLESAAHMLLPGPSHVPARPAVIQSAPAPPAAPAHSQQPSKQDPARPRVAPERV